MFRANCAAAPSLNCVYSRKSSLDENPPSATTMHRWSFTSGSLLQCVLSVATCYVSLVSSLCHGESTTSTTNDGQTGLDLRIFADTRQTFRPVHSTGRDTSTAFFSRPVSGASLIVHRCFHEIDVMILWKYSRVFSADARIEFNQPTSSRLCFCLVGRK